MRQTLQDIQEADNLTPDLIINALAAELGMYINTVRYEQLSQKAKLGIILKKIRNKVNKG